ncbi:MULTISPECIES: MOSC domain-containing protein [Thioclava]|uniref:Sulfurase n=1 Tax=Thioclava nitratireducens TaxID=1915078 RepID=A0ABM6IE51_9RHOB|nr:MULTISPECIES: sulfurase [Thioclava]AQS46966.1 sulfurase [Thioclava nitratireducens]OWY01176.1 sulfurase [Thioclava sp. F1Mire-8]OWY08603.1 sulfurase [Thioclava sp. F42-5]OWY11765.1 sulfurase [Thioclava sp. F34-6]OWY15770.1 sulfurase [Thioclava sp. JM3]
MAALKPTQYQGEVVWLGLVTTEGQLTSTPVEEIEFTFDGPVGELHGGRTRPSCSRVTDQHPKGTEIANVRQLTILSAEELAETAFAMGVPEIDPSWVGATIVLRGLPDLTHIPPSARLQNETGLTLVVDMENRPCVLPGRVIEEHYPDKGKRYKPAAHGRRGVTAWVERPGRLVVGETLRLHIPDQRAWELMDEVR